jgi:hypothetical protein
MSIETISTFAKKNNMLTGVLICALMTSILFVILPVYFFFIADIYFIVGNCVGLYFTFKNRKESQSHIKTGIIVGLVSSIIAILFLGFFIWIVISFGEVFDFFLLLGLLLDLLAVVGIFYIITGIILGFLFGNRYKKRDEVGQTSLLI